MYTVDDVMKFAEQEDVRFIRLTFFDIYGHQKNISILPDQLERAFARGIAIDAFAVGGFENERHGDLYLKPDPSTFTILPWRSVDGSVVLMICSLVYPDGTPFEKDMRARLKQAVQDAAGMGISLRMSTEFEFYLFRDDEKGRPTCEPLDTGGYLDVSPLDHGENIRREICFTLAEMGMQPQASYHQCGPGQNEVDFHASSPVRAADEASLFKWVVRTVASTNGLRADFSPRPLPEEPGNGLHVNIQVESEDFLNPIDENAVFCSFMAGVLAHIRELCLFTNPTPASYLRLGRRKAPACISWSNVNRSLLVRVPSDHVNRMELRNPDCTTSPYLVFMLLIQAGLDGVRNSMTLPDPCDMDLSGLQDRCLASLPASMEESIEAALGSGLVKLHVPASVTAAYAAREQE
ncbi:glutamine synthetase family protein [uncultured Faecalibaculum sp.]|uniref:glutamine synthetase family protein n=2 Tax=uncultured Faecalibaculum sp. TaxID=1729681 RepID=UPI002626B270|nr:glutamine synthetase family protein [uncultured Faecalibaculum sp.]